MNFKLFLKNEERINPSKLEANSGFKQSLECMKRNGAKVINIYKLLQNLSNGQKYEDYVFLGLEENNKLLNAITSLASAIPWIDMQYPGNPELLMKEIIGENKFILIFLPTKVSSNLTSGYTEREFQYLSSMCNDRNIMEKLTVVVGLHNIVSNRELFSAIEYTEKGAYLDSAKLKLLLSKWKVNMSKSPAKDNFTTNKIEDFLSKNNDKIFALRNHQAMFNDMPVFIKTSFDHLFDIYIIYNNNLEVMKSVRYTSIGPFMRSELQKQRSHIKLLAQKLADKNIQVKGIAVK